MPYDKNLELRDGASAITTSTNGSFVDLGSGVYGQLEVVVVVGTVTGTSPTLDLDIEFSTDGTNAITSEKLSFKRITATGVYKMFLKTFRRYARWKSTVGGTSPSFGAVKVEIGKADERGDNV